MLQLLPYQQEAKSRIITNKQERVFADMGTGKSAIATRAIRELFLKRKISTVIIWIPASLRLNWLIEIKKFIALNYGTQYIILDLVDDRLSPTKRLELLKEFNEQSPYLLKIVLINYDKADTMKEPLILFEKDMCIIDESHKLKSWKSKTYKAIKKINEQATYKVVMTGTYMPNGYIDIFSQFDLTSPDIFKNITSFKKRYCELGYFRQIEKYKHTDELDKIIRDNCYRIKLSDVVDLKPLTSVIRSTTLSQETRKMYDEMESEFATYVDNVTYSKQELYDLATQHGLKPKKSWSYKKLLLVLNDNIELDESTSKLLISSFTRLQQITGGWVKLDTGKMIQVSSEKAKATLEVIKEEVTGRVLVFCRFRHEMKQLHDLFQKNKLNSRIFNKKDSSYEEFKKGRIDILILQISAGVGLNLQEANNVIVYSTDYQSDAYLQAIKRVHRMGQTKPVSVFNMVCEETIDLDILSTVERKLEVSARVFREEVY